MQQCIALFMLTPHCSTMKILSHYTCICLMFTVPMTLCCITITYQLNVSHYAIKCCLCDYSVSGDCIE